jgi:hypothetical protein
MISPLFYQHQYHISYITLIDITHLFYLVSGQIGCLKKGCADGPDLEMNRSSNGVATAQVANGTRLYRYIGRLS